MVGHDSQHYKMNGITYNFVKVVTCTFYYSKQYQWIILVLYFIFNYLKIASSLYQHVYNTQNIFILISKLLFQGPFSLSSCRCIFIISSSIFILIWITFNCSFYHKRYSKNVVPLNTYILITTSQYYVLLLISTWLKRYARCQRILRLLQWYRYQLQPKILCFTSEANLLHC